MRKLLMFLLLITAISVVSASGGVISRKANEFLSLFKNLGPNYQKSKYSTSGRLFSKFIFLTELGEGSDGNVFAVKKVGDSDDGTIYAMKVISIAKALHPMVVTDPVKTIIMLNNEPQVLILLGKKGGGWAPVIHYAFRINLSLIIVQEFVYGRTLLQRLLEIKFGPESDVHGLAEREQIGKVKGSVNQELGRLLFPQMLVAVGEVHGINYCHYDIRLPNFFINAKGDVLIADFSRSLIFNMEAIEKDPSLRKLAGKKDWQDLGDILNSIMMDDPHKATLVALIKDELKDDDVKLTALESHPYFAKHLHLPDVDWNAVKERRSPAPFAPRAMPELVKDGTDYIAKYEIGNGKSTKLIRSLITAYPYTAPKKTKQGPSPVKRGGK